MKRIEKEEENRTKETIETKTTSSTVSDSIPSSSPILRKNRTNQFLLKDENTDDIEEEEEEERHVDVSCRDSTDLERRRNEIDSSSNRSKSLPTEKKYTKKMMLH